MPIADPGAGAATPAAPLSVDDQMERLTDADDVISPLTFPDPSVSVGYVEAMASGLRELGTSIADTGNDITGSWAGLSPHYSAPEAETLFSVLDPVATDGDTVGEELDRAARALENFAGDVSDIKTRWSYLRILAYDLRSRIEAEGDDWRKSSGSGESDLVQENTDLIEQGREIINDYTEVENTCANAINAGIAGRTSFEKQPEGDAELDPNVFYHGFDQDLSELAEAWGHESAQTDHPWWVDTGAAVWDFGVDAVQGVGAMVGAHSSQGWFEASWGDALKEYHWDNLTSAASLVGMYDAETDSLGPAGWDAVGEAWKDLAHSVVPWEEWGDRPGYVIGTAALNVIGLVGGAALTATGVGAVVGVPLMAWRGMAIVDGMGGSGRGGSGGGADVDLPDVSQVPRFGGSGSPLINLAGKVLDATGYGPSQLADMRAVINRLLPSAVDGTESGAGSGRSRPGEGAPETDGRTVQRPVQDPTVADALAFDDIVDHPDNQAFGEQVRSTRQDQIDQVDRAAKTGSNGAPASEEGRWTGDAGDGRGPEGMGDKEPAMAGGGRPSDTMEASAARNTPAPAEQVRLTDVDGPGGGRPFGNEIADNRGDHGADMRDRNPTAHNHDGDGPGPHNDPSNRSGADEAADSGRRNGTEPEVDRPGATSANNSGPTPTGGAGNGSQGNQSTNGSQDGAQGSGPDGHTDPELQKKLENAKSLEDTLREGGLSDQEISDLRDGSPREGRAWQRVAETVSQKYNKSVISEMLPRTIEFARNGAGSLTQFAYRFEYYKANFDNFVRDLMEQDFGKKEAQRRVSGQMDDVLIEERLLSDREAVADRRPNQGVRVDPLASDDRLHASLREMAGEIGMGDNMSAAYHARKHYHEIQPGEISGDHVANYLDSLETTILEGEISARSPARGGGERLIVRRPLLDQEGNPTVKTNKKGEVREAFVRAVVIVREDGGLVVPTYGRVDVKVEVDGGI